MNIDFYVIDDVSKGGPWHYFSFFFRISCVLTLMSFVSFPLQSISLDQCQLLLRRLELDVDITSASSLSAVLLAFTGWSAAEG